MTDPINIAGLDKAELLAALYNNSRPQGMGIMAFTPEDMTTAEAQALLDELDESHKDIVAEYILSRRYYFDYVGGRVVKCNITGDELAGHLYDRDLGQGAAARVVAKLRAKQE